MLKQSIYSLLNKKQKIDDMIDILGDKYKLYDNLINQNKFGKILNIEMKKAQKKIIKLTEKYQRMIRILDDKIKSCII